MSGRAEGPAGRQPRPWGDFRKEWVHLSIYDRFEALVSVVLRAVLAMVIAVALYRLIVGVIETLVLRSLNPLDHAVFQQVFGATMTLLIALEFNHTLQYVAVTRERGIIQARTVILIAQLALARKVIVVEFADVDPARLAALAALMVSLGVASWLLRDSEMRLPRAEVDRSPG